MFVQLAPNAHEGPGKYFLDPSLFDITEFQHVAVHRSVNGFAQPVPCYPGEPEDYTLTHLRSGYALARGTRSAMLELAEEIDGEPVLAFSARIVRRHEQLMSLIKVKTHHR